MNDLCVYRHNSKENYFLSRFYHVNVEVGGEVFTSLEHAFQAMNHEDHDPWKGEFADWDWVLARVNEGSKQPINGKYLKKKKMIGALARMVASRPLMFRLEPKPLDQPYSEEVWFPLFEAKYQGEMLNMLLKTSGNIILHDPKSNADSLLTTRFDRVLNTWVGHNQMGKMLTKFRDSKRPKRKHEVEIGQTLTLDQRIQKKFKEAEENGMIIELDLDDFLPHDWDSYSKDQKLQHAVENNWTLMQCAKYLDFEVPRNFQSASGIVLTWSHAVESGNYVKPIGTKGKGFSYQDLQKIIHIVPQTTELYKVQGSDTHVIEGHVLVIRQFIPNTQQMINEIKALPNYDIKGWFRGKCLFKSRWNTQITNRDVQGNIPEPNKDLRKSSENSFERAPTCKQVRDCFTGWASLGLDTKDLKAEVNIYGITKPGGKPPSVAPGIGRHVDGERNLVIWD